MPVGRGTRYRADVAAAIHSNVATIGSAVAVANVIAATTVTAAESNSAAIAKWEIGLGLRFGAEQSATKV